MTPVDKKQVITIPIKNDEEKGTIVSVSTFRSSCAPNLNSVKSNQEGEEDNFMIKTIHYKSNILAKIMGYHYSKKKKSNNISEVTTTNSAQNLDFGTNSEKDSLTDFIVNTNIRSCENSNYMNGSIITNITNECNSWICCIIN